MISKSRLLLDSSNMLAIQPELAVMTGDRQAMALQQLHYWIDSVSSIEAQGHFFDGAWWVHNTWEQWREKKFPFWSKATIKRIFDDLNSAGLIIIRPHENDKKGSWMTLNYGQLELLMLQSEDHPRVCRPRHEAIYPDQIAMGKNATHSNLNRYPDQFAMGTGDPKSHIESVNKEKDSAPLCSAASADPESIALHSSSLITMSQDNALAITEKSDTANGEGTMPLIPNCAQPLSTAPVAPADENAPERAASPVIDIGAIAPLANATGLTAREFAATTTPILSAPDAPVAKPKRERKAKPATPEEQAGGEAGRADFEDAKLAVCYAWQKNPLKDPRGWVWVTMMANFLVGRVGKKQQGSQWDALKLDDTPLTAAQICGFRQWWHDPERLAGMEAPPLPTVLETLQRRVQEYVADRRIGRFAEQGAAKLAEVRAEYERAISGAPAVERQPVVPDEQDMIDQDRLAQLQAMIARSAALHGRREAA